MIPSWLSVLGVVGLGTGLMYNLLVKGGKMDLYDFNKRIGAELHSIDAVIATVAKRLSKQQRAMLVEAARVARGRIGEHAIEFYKTLREREKKAREEGQAEGLKLAVSLLRAHEASVLIHLTAQETLDAVNRASERTAVRTFAAGVVSMLDGKTK